MCRRRLKFSSGVAHLEPVGSGGRIHNDHGKGGETSDAAPAAVVAEACRTVGASFERFCLTAGVAALNQMIKQDAVELCVPRYGH